MLNEGDEAVTTDKSEMSLTPFGWRKLNNKDSDSENGGNGYAK